MLSTQLHELISDNQKLSIRKLLQHTGKSSFGFLLCVLSLPSALPIPAPGYSIPFGIVIILLAVQIIIGRNIPWFPSSWLDKEISTTAFQSKLPLITNFITFFERFTKPRMTGLYRRTYRILGIMILLCGISMLIPIPGTNTMPAIGVFVIALSMIEEDSLAGVAGALIALSGIAVTVLILFFGKEALTLLWETYIK